MKWLRFILAAMLASVLVADDSLAGGPRRSSGSHSAGTGSSTRSSPVRGYTKSNGTHVAPHNRSVRDGTAANNYSTKGNVNPFTGKAGTKSMAPRRR